MIATEPLIEKLDTGGTDARPHWLYGIKYLTEGSQAYRNHLYWRGICVGVMHDQLTRQDDAKRMAALCLLLESQNLRPNDILMLDVWKEIDIAQASAATKYLLLWTSMPNAVEPWQVFLLNGDASEAPLAQRVAHHLKAFRAANTGVEAATSWPCLHYIVQSRESFAAALMELSESVDSPEDVAFDLTKFEQQRERIRRGFIQSVPLAQIEAQAAIESRILEPFEQAVAQQVQTYWRRFTPIAEILQMPLHDIQSY